MKNCICCFLIIPQSIFEGFVGSLLLPIQWKEEHRSFHILSFFQSKFERKKKKEVFGKFVFRSKKECMNNLFRFEQILKIESVSSLSLFFCFFKLQRDSFLFSICLGWVMWCWYQLLFPMRVEEVLFLLFCNKKQKWNPIFPKKKFSHQNWKFVLDVIFRW